MNVCVPGKIILSGEHAVVHGFPALALAVNRYVSAHIVPHASAEITLDLAAFSFQENMSVSALHELKKTIQQHYEKFLRGNVAIRDVLKQPVALAQFTLALCLDWVRNTVSSGFYLRVQSDIPIGCGMGSSAATIWSITHAIAQYFKITLSPETLWAFALHAENMQHGHSSGMDLRILSHGGCVLWQDHEVQARVLPAMPFYIVHTGVPQTTTGECVHAAAPFFKHRAIGEEFAAVTCALDNALQKNDLPQTLRAIRANHQLLTRIQVVPERVQQFINAVDMFGAAKICGAGAIAGDSAGIVLVVTEDRNALKVLCQQYHYSLLSVTAEPRGVHVV